MEVLNPRLRRNCVGLREPVFSAKAKVRQNDADDDNQADDIDDGVHDLLYKY
jgi:hypothetical protein